MDIHTPLINVVIPAYNEGDTITAIIKVLKQVKDISKIILVDDGSDQKSKKVYESLTGITLLTHKKNKGKLSAMRTGLDATNSKYVFFVDADIRHLALNHIIEPINLLKAQKYDAIMLTFGLDPDIYKTTGFSAMHTGQRILSKKFLTTYRDKIFTGLSWSIEANITKQLLKHKQKILICEWDSVTHRLKEEKYPPKKAWFLKTKMTVQLVIRHKIFGYLIDYIRFKPYLKNIKHISG